eukprot:3494386-Amphidinium_carterae.1
MVSLKSEIQKDKHQRIKDNKQNDLDCHFGAYASVCKEDSLATFLVYVLCVCCELSGSGLSEYKCGHERVVGDIDLDAAEDADAQIGKQSEASKTKDSGTCKQISRAEMDMDLRLSAYPFDIKKQCKDRVVRNAMQQSRLVFWCDALKTDNERYDSRSYLAL